jgi:O-antigen ligase
MGHKKKQKNKQEIVKTYKDKFYWIYLVGFFAILSLPLLNLPPWFAPPDWGKTVVFRIILSVLIFIFFYQVLFEKNQLHKFLIISFWHKVKNRKNKIFWPFWLLIALLGIYSLATLFSSDIRFSLWGSPYRGGGFVNFAFYVLFALLLLIIARKKDWQKIWDFSIFVGVLVSIIAIFQQLGLFSKVLIPFSGRPPSTIGGPTFLALYLLLLSFLALSFAIKEKRYLKKIFYSSSFLLFIYIILVTGSRAAYFGLFISFFYFIFFYSTHLLRSKTKTYFLLLKILIGILLISSAYGVYYLNSQAENPEFIQKNRILRDISNRLSIKMVLDDPRFSSWKISMEAVKDKPLLGYGPENFSIGFDKYYDPSLPYIDKAWGSWWDRAHNFAFEIAVTTGIPSLIVYLSLFAILFWQLQRTKNPKLETGEPKQINDKQHPVIVHGIQATFIGYLSANFFGFDVYSTYLILFLLISYSLYIILSRNDKDLINENIQNKRRNYDSSNSLKLMFFFMLIGAFAWFVWSCNLKPLGINTEISKSDPLAKKGKCEQVVEKMDNLLLKKSYIDSYVRLRYIDFLRECAGIYPHKNYEYAKKGTEILKQNTAIQPKFTRNWILLTGFTSVLIEKEKDPIKRQELIENTEYYLEKALELSPKHQEVFTEWIKTLLVKGDYQKMKEKSEECISLNKKMAGCYWYLGLSEIFLGENELAQEHLAMASQKGYKVDILTSLNQLKIAYSSTENYEELVKIYEKLINLNPEEPQYHASLAFVYKNLKEYEKAKQEALIFLDLKPEAKDEVEIFLKTINAD